MNLKQNTIVAVACFALFASCDSSNPSGGGFWGSSIVFSPGTNHVFSWSFEMKDSLGTIVGSDSDNVVMKVIGTDESIDSLTGLIKLEAYSQRDNLGSQFVWYRQNQDSLVEIAYAGPGRTHFVLPKRNRNFGKEYGDENGISPAIIPKTVQLILSARSIHLDSIQFRTDIRVVYKFPLTAGKEWSSFRDPFLQTRQVVGWENVSVKGGIFYCAKILTRLPELAPDLEWYDYVSTQGIVLRTIYFGNGMLVDENGNVVGIVSSFERSEMIQ